MRGRNFNDKSELEEGLARSFASKDTLFFKYGIHKLISRWEKVVKNNGKHLND